MTEAQLERMWRLDGQPICCFDGDAAGQKAAVRAAMRALPHLGPERTLRFVALPAGQDPDDIVRQGGRAAIEALLAKPEPLVERLWRHEVEAAPLDTPEARAGLKAAADGACPGDRRAQSSASSTATNGCGGSTRWSARSGSSRARAGRSTRGANGRNGAASSSPPDRRRPASDLRTIGAGGIDRPTPGRWCWAMRSIPTRSRDHVEDVGRTCRSPTAAAAKLRDRMVDLIMSGQMLDRDGITTILADTETASAWQQVSKGGDDRSSASPRRRAIRRLRDATSAWRLEALHRQGGDRAGVSGSDTAPGAGIQRRRPMPSSSG